MWKEKKDNDLFGDSLCTTVHDDATRRYQMIAIAAYFRAEKRGFAPDNDLEDWLEAERDIKIHLDSFSA